MNKVDVPETRGKWTKYNFAGMLRGESRKFRKTTTNRVLNCAKYYTEKNNLNWEFRTYTQNGYIVIVRIE